jgi:pimeloyl-ACP methyl ester carboxylesterase
MPKLSIGETTLFYEEFGPKQPARRAPRPVLLIHGSTSTGRNDWDGVIDDLAERRRVIVPDCRGHGRSPNPRAGYAFREMAADLAELTRRLDAAPAHIVGHSNGGNVALVMALEEAGVVASATIQAGNAYVSPDLLDREPPLFDPDRVDRESPAWRDEMIRLHGVTHGPDYWRTLLRITLAEILAAPNYAPDDLARVRTPTLVIEGERDPVNAPAGHGAFIARHIPNAQLWRPEGVGHNVHLEVREAWLAQVQKFWEACERGEGIS